MKLNELKAEIVRKGLNIEDFGEKIGMAKTTLWRRFSEPNDFTLQEMTTIKQVLDLSNEKMLDIFFAD